MSALDERLFADPPARDERFEVGEVWADLANLPPGDPRTPTEFLHRQMNEEINSLEISARNLVDFPDAPWELRLAMARQCWDEARHVVVFRRLFEARGGTLGEYPVLNFQYRLITRLPSLVGRLAVQNRSFEAAGMDAIQFGIDVSADSGQTDVAELLEAQLADEVQHVRYANEWIPRLVAQGGPRAAFDLAKAISQANEALAAIAGGALERHRVSEDLRREAGFSEGEIDAVRAFPDRV